MAHQYSVCATATPEQLVDLTAFGLPTLVSGPPTEFGGSGNEWSPEDLLVAAVADCFTLSFKAIATASRFSWTTLHCNVTGTLDNVDRGMQFTEMKILANLTIPADSDANRAERLLEKAEHACFITNSLNFAATLEIQVITG